MNFEEAYQKTLAKWQRIAAGEFIDPASNCGICEWAIERRETGEICLICPAYHHYGHECWVLPCIIDADVAFLADDKSGLRRFAHRVVEELLSIKVSLFVEAKWIASRKEE